MGTDGQRWSRQDLEGMNEHELAAHLREKRMCDVDREAIARELFERLYIPVVQRLEAQFRNLGKEDAEEIVADAVAALIRYLRSRKPGNSTLSYWVLCRSQMRARGRLRRRTRGRIGESLDDICARLERLANPAELHIAQEALLVLPPQLREEAESEEAAALAKEVERLIGVRAFRLLTDVSEGRSYRDMAVRHQRKESTLRTQVKRLRKRVRLLLGKRLEGRHEHRADG